MLKKMLFLLPVLISAACVAQDIQINQQNKTIAVTADESVSADAEVAVLDIGYHNYAAAQDLAFGSNVRVARAITKALLQANVPEGNIETEKLRLGPAQAYQDWTEQMKKERAFEAQQSWHVSVSVAQAKTVVDAAVRAGANEIDDVEWNVIDPVALQAEASGAALAKARSIAEQMAKGLGIKLGELVYASNRAPVPRMWRGMVQTSQAEVAGTATEQEPRLKLFPQKVKSDATVYAVFAIQ
jgi:uncharacterized protein